MHFVKKHWATLLSIAYLSWTARRIWLMGYHWQAVVFVVGCILAWAAAALYFDMKARHMKIRANSCHVMLRTGSPANIAYYEKTAFGGRVGVSIIEACSERGEPVVKYTVWFFFTAYRLHLIDREE